MAAAFRLERIFLHVAKRHFANHLFKIVFYAGGVLFYWLRLCQGHGSRAGAPRRLSRNRLRFLLAREANTSILRSFELGVIGRYFPEYEPTIKEMLD
jgi:hypothetical protein